MSDALRPLYAEFLEWEESKHKRAKDGKFGSGGSGAEPKEDAPKGKKNTLKDIAAKGLAAFKTVGHKAKHLEHVAHAFVTDGIPERIAKLPNGIRQTVSGVWHLTKLGTKAAFATFIAGQDMAERVAKERGLNDEQAAKLRGICTAVDLAGAKAVPLTLGAIGLGAFGVGGSFIPLGSASYLAYSTAKDPMAVLRAAKGKIKDVLSRKKKTASEAHGGGHSPKAVSRLAEAIRKAGSKGDWFAALVSAALDDVKDLDAAIDAAEEAMQE